MRRFLALILFAAPAALAQGTLEVIPLSHRTAEQVLPVLRPLLEPGGAMSGQSNQLIVRTSAGNLAQIRAALAAIDRPLRRLAISVRFDHAQQEARTGVDADARISNRGSSADLRIADSRSALEERVDQRIQVLEGGRAVIATGESRPLRERQVYRTPGGAVVTEGTVIQEAATGFEVVPRLSGSNVFLEIAPQRENFAAGAGGAMQSERAATTVSGRLGEWIELGAASASAARSRSSDLSSRESTSSGERRIWVKVEEAGN
jgi:type II secretory pathway component GspD/PulD (secretin)